MSFLSLSRRPPLRKLQVLLLAGLAWLLLAELGYRAYRAIRGRPYSAVWAETRFDALLGDLRGTQFLPKSTGGGLEQSGFAIHPYMGFQTGQFTHEGRALASYFASEEAKSNFDIVLLGGSVACVFGNWSQTCLLPALEADPRLAGRKVRLHSLACPGHKQPQHVITLEWFLAQGCRPDAVILLDGFNDIAVAAENGRVGVHPLFPYWPEMQLRLSNSVNEPGDLQILGRTVAACDEAEQLRAGFASWPLTASALAGTWEVHRLEGAVRRARGQMLALQEHQKLNKSGGLNSITVHGPEFDNAAQAVQALSVEAWRQGSISIQASCQARGIFFLHVLQPSPADKDSKPLTDDEKHALRQVPLWNDAIAAGYPVLREVGAELSRRGIHFFDATQAFAGHTERLYIDSCHFEGEGCAILGAQVAAEFLKSWKP